jgi:putative methyltransferase
MMYDMLLGSGKIRGGGVLKKLLQERKSDIAKLWAEVAPSNTRHTVQQGIKYGRVNGIITNKQEIEEKLKSAGLTLVNDAGTTLGTNQWRWDNLVPDLAQFSAALGSGLPSLQAVQEHKIILQDKASCLSVLALKPFPDAHVIDACAAPGNKTSQIAAALGMQGKLTALERDPTRFQVLSRRMREFGAAEQRTSILNTDFLSLDPKDERWKDVRCILADPTCSGSGAGSPAVSAERVRKLAAFQTRILCHALSFPAVERVAYSTCSVLEDEDEAVVRAALDRFPDWRLEHALPEWPRRGLGDMTECVRVNPDEDCAHGFFVAVLVRHIQ